MAEKKSKTGKKTVGSAGNDRAMRTRIGERTNLLEMEAVHYTVQDVPEPNLLREFFE